MGRRAARPSESEVPVTLASTAEDQINLVARTLIEKYDGLVPTSAIHDAIAGVAVRLRDARIQTYVPVLLKREVEDLVRRLVDVTRADY
jgi:hypothetical protein